MALQKDKESKGFTGNYWRVLQINSNMDRNDCVVTIGLYKDEATRQSDPNAIMESRQFDLGEDMLGDNVTDDDTYKNIKLKEAYKILKTKAIAENAKEEDKEEDLAYFADAIDI